jgi:hypothetical protein
MFSLIKTLESFRYYYYLMSFKLKLQQFYTIFQLLEKKIHSISNRELEFISNLLTQRDYLKSNDCQIWDLQHKQLPVVSKIIQ